MAISEKRNVVLVHGIYDSAHKMQSLAASLRERGFETFTPTLTPRNGGPGLDLLAGQLWEYIDREIGPEAPMSLIGFSMGGLVTRYYVQRLGGIERVTHLITLATPHHGTAFAWMQNTRGVRQMRIGSHFVRSLNADANMLRRIRFASIWTPLDLIIIPAHSSRMAVGQNFPRWAVAHPLMVFQRNIQQLVVRLLEE